MPLKPHHLHLLPFHKDLENKERIRERAKKKCDYFIVRESPELVAGATVRRDHAQLATTDKHPRPSSCSSRREEAVDTNHASNGSRTKLHAPPENSPRRAREPHAPPPVAEPPRIPPLAAVSDQRSPELP
ncbi:unnamed protein product [Brassica napus]|uniref:(rape) hypothetical protein n=1 Tax=Brassica napus TaxID=3708 RepID=A0A816JXG7_BRANA|nr:unnamed protein product [Brassica napus]